MRLRFSITRDVKIPVRAHPTDAGIDFFIPYDVSWDTFSIYPNCSVLIPSGVKMDIPEGYMLLSLEKSGIAQNGLICGARVVDSGYQGEIHIHIINTGKNPAVIHAGQKIVQFVLVPILTCEIEEVGEDQLFEYRTNRGSDGFGSTGI